MDKIDPSGGIDTLIQRTADMVELTMAPSKYNIHLIEYIKTLPKRNINH
jgi:hypothetical protein